MNRAFLSFLILMLSFGFASAAPEPDLKVEIIPPAGEAATGTYVTVRVRFTNPSASVIRILRPLPFSEWGWQAPFYNATLRDHAGKPAPPLFICGNCFFDATLSPGTKWPRDYVIALTPGGSTEVSFTAPFQVLRKGVFTLGFEYAMPANAISPMKLRYPENIWHGKAVAKEVSLSLGAKK